MTKRLHMLALIFVQICLAAGIAHGQATDAQAKVQALIASNGSVPYTHLVSKVGTRTECSPPPGNPHENDPDRMNCGPVRIYVNVPQTDSITPTASNIRILSNSEPQLDPVVTTSFPDQITAYGQELVNCSSSTTQKSISLSVSFQQTNSAALSQSVTNTQQFSLSVASGADFLGTGAKVTATFQLGSSQTNGTVSTTAASTTTTRSTTSNTTLTPGQAVVDEIEVWPVTYTQTFHTSVVVDADLSPNDKFGHLSDMFPDPASRTIPVSGNIAITDASTGKVVTLNDPNGSATCSGADSGVKQITPNPATKLIRVDTTPISPNASPNASKGKGCWFRKLWHKGATSS